LSWKTAVVITVGKTDPYLFADLPSELHSNTLL